MTAMATSTLATKPTTDAAALLPPALSSLPLGRLQLPAMLVADLAAHGLLTFGDAVRATAEFAPGGMFADHREALRTAVGKALHDGLAQFTELDALDATSLRARLLGPLGEAERDVVDAVIGFTQPPLRAIELARRLGISTPECDDRIEQVRAHLVEAGNPLVQRLHQEMARELTAFDGVLLAGHEAEGSLLGQLGTGTDRATGLRLLAFLFPHEVHLHRDVLFGTSPRRFRQLLRTLPRAVPPHRLPLRVDTLLAELAGSDIEVPRGVLLHTLRTEARVAIELDEALGEIAVADPRSPAARLLELLQEAGQPLAGADLLFAYRERFRTASRHRVDHALRHTPEFVQCGPDTWALRDTLTNELAAVAPLVDKVARRLCAEGGRHHVATLLAEDATDERTVWLVLDRLAADPRVRMLGRGDACAATHQRSRAMDRLMQDFRRAGGDVVLSRFLANQPADNRRLVERLLRQNRLFVQPGPDRIDVLPNYPFNPERMRRLLTIVQEQLRQRSGYATGAALKTVLDCTDLGGSWLQPALLTDILRRHGPFEVLPNGIVARGDLGLANGVRSVVRQALRDARLPLTVDEVLRARPDLSEFAGCLAELLTGDPLVQSPDGVKFMLA